MPLLLRGYSARFGGLLFQGSAVCPLYRSTFAALESSFSPVQAGGF